MPGFKLQTPKGELVGFLLLQGKESVGTGPNPRNCIFMSVPARVELVEHKLNAFLTENRTTEFCCSFSQIGDVWEASISISEEVWVQLHCSEGGSGEWRVQVTGGDERSGQCQQL